MVPDTSHRISVGRFIPAITRMVEASLEGQTKLLYRWNHIRRFIGMVGMIIQKDSRIDRGIPLPGSDPERRSRIKQQINLLKSYLLLYRIDEWRTLFPHAESPKEWAETVPVVLLSIP
jgi:hypothetical protein